MSAFTDDEAKRKWCPFARAQRGDGTSGVNRDTLTLGADVDCKCIASGCMAWRWAGAEMVKRSYLRSTGESLEENRAYLIADVVTKEEPNSDRRGFCGLVGAPR